MLDKIAAAAFLLGWTDYVELSDKWAYISGQEKVKLEQGIREEYDCELFEVSIEYLEKLVASNEFSMTNDTAAAKYGRLICNSSHHLVSDPIIILRK